MFLFLIGGLPFIHLPARFLVYHVQFAAGAGLLCVMLHRAPIPTLVNGVLERIGRISFSMYVLHFALLAPVFTVARALTDSVVSRGGDVALLAIYYPLVVIATTACAVLTHEMIERPGMRIGRLVIASLQQRGNVIERPA
jgi:peptidoglycan/LPS O-acetylase OafA/YrhL